MRITIVLPFLRLTGGIRLMLQYANWLHSAGHPVNVVVPTWPYRFHFTRGQQLSEFRHNLRNRPPVSWMPVLPPIMGVPVVRSWFLPPADVVIATSWPTASDVAGLSDRCGRKVHIVMHHEGGTGDAEAIRRIYELPLERITISAAIQQELRDAWKSDVRAVIPAAVDESAFFTEGDRSNDTVCMLYHPDPRKGAADGVEALSALRARFESVRVDCCGTVPAPALPPWIRFRLQPSDAELRRMFSRSAAFLYPSRYEGFGLPPLEAMACGCPVVSTRVGAVPEYARDGTNALLVLPGDVPGMADRLHTLLTDRRVRDRLTQNGPATAALYSIERGARQLEGVLKELSV